MKSFKAYTGPRKDLGSVGEESFINKAHTLFFEHTTNSFNDDTCSTHGSRQVGREVRGLGFFQNKQGVFVFVIFILWVGLPLQQQLVFS